MCNAIQGYIYLCMNLGDMARKSQEVGLPSARPMQGIRTATATAKATEKSQATTLSN
jgi:hypothetical protein